MSRDNPGWGAPRIHGELLKLGIQIGETSVGKYMVRRRKPPSQTWRTFLDNHLQQLVSIDFFTVSRSFTYFWCWPMTGVALSTST
jgi:putative transposase